MRTLFQLSFVAVIALSFNAGADEPKPQPVRTLFSHHDQSGVPGKEIVIGTAMLPPETAIGFHTHPGGITIRGGGQVDFWRADRRPRLGGSVHSFAGRGLLSSQTMSPRGSVFH
jgi:hypothetical protein